MLDRLKHNTLNKMRRTTGWLTDKEAEWLFDRASERRCILEFGAYQGKSTIVLANAVGMNPIPRKSAIFGLPDEEPTIGGLVVTVDHWHGGNENPSFYSELQQVESRKEVINKFLLNTLVERETGRLLVLEAEVLSASVYLAPFMRYRRFDMVFIDASHDKASVAKDIEAALPLLAPGGLLCGHDYYFNRDYGVAGAVDEYFPQREIAPETSIWHVTPQPIHVKPQ